MTSSIEASTVNFLSTAKITCLKVDILHKVGKTKSNRGLFSVNMGTLQCDNRPFYSCV